ncbi:MAG: hypothetical protein IJG87_05960 [Ruminococcus sp.]|nr:hypothetical protein [Ruminococcus sp.]
MNLTERIAYIRGLAEGLGLDENKDEVKVINAIIDLLEDMAYDVADMENIVDDVCNQVDEIDGDLAEVEEEVYGWDDDESWYDEDDFDEDEDDFDPFDDDEPYYEVTCPACNETTIVDEDALIEGELDCPYCGAEIEFDFSELKDDLQALDDTDEDDE